jgi:hypothetical protein
VAPSEKQRIVIIDRYGELRRKVAEFKPVSDEAGKLEKEIASWYSDEPAGETFVEAGKSYTVQVGKKSLERTVTDMPKLSAILGLDRFLQLCRFPLAAIDQHLPPSQIPEVLLSERSGERAVKAVAKSSPVRKAA